MILKGAGADEIRAAAERDVNFRPLREDAVNKMLQGIISLEDAVTVMKR
jgi:type II secretory ATPase GspE/PulE/Tfp pilus assembly ATPase PilB-like protein